MSLNHVVVVSLLVLNFVFKRMVLMKTNHDPTAHPVNYERLIVTVTKISKVFLYLVIEFGGQSGVATKETN